MEPMSYAETLATDLLLFGAMLTIGMVIVLILSMAAALWEWLRDRDNRERRIHQ